MEHLSIAFSLASSALSLTTIVFAWRSVREALRTLDCARNIMALQTTALVRSAMDEAKSQAEPCS